MSLKHVKLTHSIITQEGLYSEVKHSLYSKILPGNIPVAPVQPIDTPCWLWTGARDRGYAKFTLTKSKQGIVYVRRGNIISHIIHVGPTNGDMILHLCQEKLCVRPDHLMVGNASINGIQATLNRANVPLFNRSWKLTTAQVKQIRQMHFKFGLKPSEIAPMFNVSTTCIRDAISGKTYSYVK